MRERVRAAIVGAGIMGRWHAAASRRAGGRIVAVVDRDGRRADALAKRYRRCRPVADLAEALDAVDVVHVCTPTESHVALATQALTAGRHVLVEKPLAATADATEALIALARSRDRLLCPVHQFLFQDGTEAALEALPRIAPLRHVDVRMCSAGGAEADPLVRDRIACEILPHPLALLARMLPGSLDLFDWTVKHPDAGEIRALGQFDRVTASLLISMAGRPNVNRVDLIGERGTLHLDWFGGFRVVHTGGVSGIHKLTRPFAFAAWTTVAAAANLGRRAIRWEPAYAGLQSLVARFYDAVGDRGAAPIPETETLAVARACDRFQSALEREARAPARVG